MHEPSENIGDASADPLGWFDWKYLWPHIVFLTRLSMITRAKKSVGASARLSLIPAWPLLISHRSQISIPGWNLLRFLTTNWSRAKNGCTRYTHETTYPGRSPRASLLLSPPSFQFLRRRCYRTRSRNNSGSIRKCFFRWSRSLKFFASMSWGENSRFSMIPLTQDELDIIAWYRK